MIDIRGLCPLLQVFDLDASIRFYTELLGFTVKERASGWAWLVRDDTDLMLNTLFDPDEQPETPPPGYRTGHGDVTIYFGCPDVAAAYEHLTAHGLEIAKPRVASYGMKQLYLEDPDGYGICFQWRA